MINSFLLLLLGHGATVLDDSVKLALSNIYLSSGTLKPAFDPDILDYKVDLDYPVDQIAITPKLHPNLTKNDGRSAPSINMSWKNYWNGKEEAASIAVRRQIDLPDDGDNLPVNIQLTSSDKKATVNYKITVKQAAGKPSILKAIDGADNNDYGIIVSPFVNEDTSVYDVYVKPQAKYLKLKFYCSGGSGVMVEGKKYSNGSIVKVTRERDHHRQPLEVVCSKGSFLKESANRVYVVSLISDYYPQDITVPDLVLNNSGQKCIYHADKKKFTCPDPKDGGKKAQITGSIDPAIRHTIESPDKAVEVRMLDGFPTIPFTYRGDLEVVATSGRYTERYALRFEGGVVPGLMRSLGFAMAIILALLLFALIAVVGTANLSGIGVPFGATEIVSTATLLLQYLCFSCYMRGTSTLTDLITPLRWVTLFWPLPWDMQDPNGTHHMHSGATTRKLFEAAPSYGVEMWGSSYMGDATDVRNALGSMFFGTVILGVLLVFHLVVLCFYFYHKYNTLPHRIKIGNWESMLLHWLVFPVCTGASMVLFHPKTNTLAKGVAGGVFAVFFSWLLSVLAVIYSRVRSRSVTWVWQSSTREDGVLESDNGYWCDLVCDQLTTHPVDRSFFGKVFKWKWISTVADVEPISINPMADRIKNNDTFGPNDYYYHHVHHPLPVSKNPKTVEVIRTVSRPKLAPGQRLAVGMVRTSWLDMLFSYQALIALHNQVVHDTSRAFTIPLTVKLSQLTGPYTGGSNAYFFDGARVPFIRIFDSMFRMLLGLCMGMALASTRHSVDTAAFASICAISGCSMGYIIYCKPYARHIENFMSIAVSGAICITSLTFMIYAAQKKDPSILTDVLLWTISLLCVVIAVYAGIVIVSVFSAIICPPLDETRFLESIANCNVTISNHRDEQSWAVDIPAFTKYNCRSLKAACSSNGKKLHVSMYQSGEEATLEFSVRDVAHACRTGQMNAPRVCVIAPSDHNHVLGYRHVNIYDEGSIMAEVGHFLSGDNATRHVAEYVAQQITHQVQRNSKGRTMLIVTVIPPRLSQLANTTREDASREGASREASRESHSVNQASRHTASRNTNRHSSRPSNNQHVQR